MDQQSSLVASKKVENNKSVELQLVSRRRLAFRPNSIRPTITQQNEGAPEIGKSAPPSSHQNAQQNILPATNEVDKARRILWSFSEQAVLYEALKLHGKDFELLSKFMIKRKISKDKEQIRNYYLNTYKLWKAKAQIDEAEWAGIPRDARELFILLNGMEWRKRLDGALFDQNKFKTLILEGAVSFRPKRKKFLVTIRTPYCPPLLKYFPYDRKGSDIPTHVNVKLKPLRNQDREMIVFYSEQNPFLELKCNVNDKISTIFQFLENKWLKNINAMMGGGDNEDNGRIKLFADATQVHKILIGVAEENSPQLSLNRLKKDFEMKQTENSESCSTEKFCTVQRDTKFGTSTKEIFEINEEKIRGGLTKNNVGVASILQLFYLLGMNDELVFNYEINGPKQKWLPWEWFLTLVNRDYDESMAKSLTNPAGQKQPPKLVMTMDKLAQNSTDKNAITPAEQMGNNNILEEENLQFIRQIKAQTNQQRRPKRQIKLVHDNQKIFNRIHPGAAIQPSFHSNSMQRFAIRNGIILNMDNQKHNNFQERCLNDEIQLINCQQPSTSYFQSQHFSSPSESRLVQPNQRAASKAANECEINSVIDMSNEISFDSTTFSPLQSVVLDTSPNKSLPEDVRMSVESMLKESSVDYCRKFEKLTRMHQEDSPSKIARIDEEYRMAKS